MNNFQKNWRAAFGHLPPLGYELRCPELADRSVRFHALPGSKRYATTPEETAQILERARALGTAALGKGRPCWLVISRSVYDPSDAAGSESAIGRYRLTPAMKWSDPNDPPEDRARLTFYAGEVVWKPGAFTDVLTEIAEDRERALFADLETGSVFAPYDGGFDLFLPDSRSAGKLRIKHADWLSTRPDGR